MARRGRPAAADEEVKTVIEAAEQLIQARGPALTVYNYAGAGATTGDVLSGDATKKAAIRALKRHLADVIYRALHNDHQLTATT